MSGEMAPSRSHFTLGGLLGLAAALVGFGIGAQRLGDNSFLTHLATGRRMLDVGIVREDAFTWTSVGEPVVVQSWLASLLYGVLDELAGFAGIRLLMAATAATLAWLVWRLTERSPSITTRLLVVVSVLFIGLRSWTERPLLLAFLFFAFTLDRAERSRDPRVLAAAGALWVNVHGSWPLGVVVLLTRLVGARLDRSPPEVDAERRAVTWLGAGMVLGGTFNPYGPALLWFPVELLGKQETLRHISEWQASSFQSLWTRLFIVLIVAALFAARRAPLRLVVPGAVFVAAALLSARNIPVAALVLVPLLAGGLPALPGPGADRRSDAIRLGGVALAAMIGVLAVLTVRGPHTITERYPVDAVDALETMDLSPADHHLVHQDFVGNFLDLRYGGVAAAWIDDRFELHDATLVDDYLALLHGEPGWREAIARHAPDAVLWERDRVLVELLVADGWATVWTDDDWVVMTPRETPS